MSGQRGPKLSVVIPVYNERFTLRELVRRVRKVEVDKEIILVDDGSCDGSQEIVKSFEGTPGIKVLFHAQNRGKGAAIQTALPHVEGDIVVIQDADLEYDPREYPQLLQPILNGYADVVYGSRFEGTPRRVLYFWHALGNRLLTGLSNMLNNLTLTDMETCYKVFRTDVIRALYLRSRDFRIEPEITAKLAKLRVSIYEVPISYQGRTYEEGKKISWLDGLKAIGAILRFGLFEDVQVTSEGATLSRTLTVMLAAGAYNRWLFEQISPFLGRQVVEIGSGVGNITKFLMDRDRVVVSDVFPPYLRRLRAQFGDYGNVTVAELDVTKPLEGVEGLRGDTVVCMNVLEHIEHDRDAVGRIGALLQPGGRTILLVPACPALYCAIDQHLGHYRRYSLAQVRSLLEHAGFAVEHSRYVNMLGAVGWFVNGRALRRNLLPSRQMRFFDRLVPLLSLERFLGPPFGLSVLAVGRKAAT